MINYYNNEKTTFNANAMNQVQVEDPSGVLLLKYAWHLTLLWHTKCALSQHINESL